MAKIKAATEKYNGVMPRLLLFCKYVRAQGDKILDSPVSFFYSRKLPFPGFLKLK